MSSSLNNMGTMEDQLEMLLALEDLIEETATLRDQGSIEDINQHFLRRNGEVLQLVETLPNLAAIEDDADTVLQASHLMQGILISEHWGHDPLRHPSTEDHGINLIALGLAVGAPQSVFIGQANRLLGQALQTDDPKLAPTLIEELRRLSDNDSRQLYGFIIDQIPKAIGRLERIIADHEKPQTDPDLERLDPLIAEWVAQGNTEMTGRMRYRAMGVLINAFEEDLPSQDIEYFYNAVISALQSHPGFTTRTYSDDFLHSYLLIAHCYYRGMMERSTTEARAALADAAIQLGNIAPEQRELPKKIPAMWHLGLALAADMERTRSPETKLKQARLAREGFAAGGTPIDEVEAMLLEGESLTQLGDQKDAFSVLDAARVKAKTEGLLPEEVNACIGLAVLLFTLDLKKEAADLFIKFIGEHPLNGLHDDRSRRAVAQAMTELALMYRATNNFKDYRALINQAAALFNQANLPRLAEEARAR